MVGGKEDSECLLPHWPGCACCSLHKDWLAPLFYIGASNSCNTELIKSIGSGAVMDWKIYKFSIGRVRSFGRSYRCARTKEIVQ